jgi:hypothetical protein
MAQAMTGDTTIAPSPFFSLTTDYRSAYGLIGVDLDEWWLAARAEVFDTRTRTTFGPDPTLSEVGRAFTFAANYAPATSVRLSGEYMLVNSSRDQRILDGDPAHIVEHQFQLSLRFFF